MTIEEANSIFNLEEKEDRVILQYRKLGKEIPGKVKEALKLVENKEYNLKGKLPEGVGNITVLFSKGILYHIKIQYLENYFQKVNWDLFVSSVAKQYGRPREIEKGRTNAMNSEIAISQSLQYCWSDDKTKLKIRKTSNFTEKEALINTAYDVFYTDIATAHFVSSVMSPLGQEVVNK